MTSTEHGKLRGGARRTTGPRALALVVRAPWEAPVKGAARGQQRSRELVSLRVVRVTPWRAARRLAEVAPLDGALRDKARRLLALLTPHEEQVLRLRFGIGESRDHSLEEIGWRFAVTRERIRQIEVNALRKLRHPGGRRPSPGLAAG